MKSSFVLETTYKFLKIKAPRGAVLLLGLSGGPDSMALLHILLECRKLLGFELIAVHVDHGWREESAREAELLKEMCQELSVPFMLKKVNFESLKKKNIEDQLRVLRHQLFYEAYLETNASALTLAHHSDDQAETVLKRILEGASLEKCVGIQAELELLGMRVIRPLLSLTKEHILEWLKIRDISYFLDYTNEDSKYLRARMRKSLLPFLEEEFGKNTKKNLCSLAESAVELEEYLTQKTAHIEKLLLQEAGGFSLPLKPLQELAAFERKFVLKKICQILAIRLSRVQIATLSDMIGSNRGGKVLSKSCVFLVKGKKIMILVQMAVVRDFHGSKTHAVGIL